MIGLALLTAVIATAEPLSERVPDVATRFCVDLISRSVPVPAVGNEEQRVFARYGLTAGVPNAAIQALGPAGTSLLSRATLASGEASDGAFVVALGGTAGETCRVIVYSAPRNGQLVVNSSEAMKTKGRGWKLLVHPAQAAVALRLTFLKRDAANKPFIANLIAPVVTGPVAMIVNVAAVPPTVTIPQGF